MSNELAHPPAAGTLAHNTSAIEVARSRIEALEVWRQIALHALAVRDVNEIGKVLRANRGAVSKLFAAVGGKMELLKDEHGRPIREIEHLDHPILERVTICTYYARYTRPDGVAFEAAGSFSTADPFFSRANGSDVLWQDVNLADIYSAAMTEATKKALIRALGLDAGWEPGELDGRPQAGGHTFSGQRAEDPLIGIGRNKGKKVSEVSALGDLEWLHKVTTENLNDPAKSKHTRTNRALLEALDRRIAEVKGGSSAPKAASAEPAPAPRVDPETGEVADEPAEKPKERDPAPEGPAPTRGALINRVNERLVGMLGRSPKAHGEMLRAVTGAWGTDARGTITGLTNEELQRLLDTPDEALAEIAKHA